MRRPNSGLRRHSKGPRQDRGRAQPRHPNRYSRGAERRANEQARLDADDEYRVLDTRPALAGGVELGKWTPIGQVGTRPWEGSGGDGRSLGAAAPPLVLRENSATLQNRVNDLQNNIADETTRRKRA